MKPLSFPSVVVLSMAKASVYAFQFGFNVVATRNVAWMLVFIHAIGWVWALSLGSLCKPSIRMLFVPHSRGFICSLVRGCSTVPIACGFVWSILITQCSVFKARFRRLRFPADFEETAIPLSVDWKNADGAIAQFFEMPFCWYRKRGTERQKNEGIEA